MSLGEHVPSLTFVDEGFGTRGVGAGDEVECLADEGPAIGAGGELS